MTNKIIKQKQERASRMRGSFPESVCVFNKRRKVCYCEITFTFLNKYIITFECVKKVIRKKNFLYSILAR